MRVGIKKDPFSLKKVVKNVSAELRFQRSKARRSGKTDRTLPGKNWMMLTNNNKKTWIKLHFQFIFDPMFRLTGT